MYSPETLRGDLYEVREVAVLGRKAAAELAAAESGDSGWKAETRARRLALEFGERVDALVHGDKDYVPPFVLGCGLQAVFECVDDALENGVENRLALAREDVEQAVELLDLAGRQLERLAAAERPTVAAGGE